MAGAADAASSSLLLLMPSSLSSPSESLLSLLPLLMLLALVSLPSSLPLESESELDEVRVRSTIAHTLTGAAEAASAGILVGLRADAPATPFPAAPTDLSAPAALVIIIRMRRARMPSTSSSFLRTSNTRSSDT
jgi:hypothetical protein